MDIVFAEEQLQHVLEEMKPMLLEHWEEVAMYKDKIDFSPDYNKYFSMCDMGFIRLYTMRDNGKLVGYSLFFTMPHLHYSKDMFAVNDVVFVDPEYRLPFITPAFFNYVEEQLSRLGMSVITYHMKVYKPFEKLMNGLQYNFTEHLYTKYIRD